MNRFLAHLNDIEHKAETFLKFIEKKTSALYNLLTPLPKMLSDDWMIINQSIKVVLVQAAQFFVLRRLLPVWFHKESFCRTEYKRGIGLLNQPGFYRVKRGNMIQKRISTLQFYIPATQNEKNFWNPPRETWKNSIYPLRRGHGQALTGPEILFQQNCVIALS